MKVLVLTFLALVSMAGAAQAQCGCAGPVYAPVVQTRMLPPPAPVYVAPPVHSAPMAPAPSYGPASISYINKLANPIQRPNYMLNYAIHLTDGRVLLSDVLPSGYQVQGVENQAVSGQRRLSVSMSGNNAVTVRDPQTNSTVAIFSR